MLIVDEVSMLSGELFDKLEYKAKKVRGNEKPFGGIQLVLVGDLLQLPLVSQGFTALRTFQAASWDKCVDKYMKLDQALRQTDRDFIRALRCIRVGAGTEEVDLFI